jgi:predicted CoA-binding protein
MKPFAPMLTTDDELTALLRRTRRIAVVGMSPNESKPSHYVPRYMLEHDYEIIPVNPLYGEIAGMPCYPDLNSVPPPIDMVNVFRRAEDVPPVVEEAIAAGAKSVWIQLGIVNIEAARRAASAGLDVVMDLCVKVEHARLFEPPRG